jgi:hypothetical protein
MSQSWRFASAFRSPHPDQQQEETDARYADGLDAAYGEIYDTNALSFADMYGKRSVYHL